MTASESRESAPTGVLSSWLTLATKSRRTASIRRASVRSSTSSSTSREPSGATRAETARASPRPVPRRGRSSSTCRISPSRRVSRAMCSIGSTASLPPRTSPRAYAAELALTTASPRRGRPRRSGARTGRCRRRAEAPASVCREVRVGAVWSRSLQRNASMAMTPVQHPGDRCRCGDRRVHVHASRLGVVRGRSPSRPGGDLEHSSPRVHLGDSDGSFGRAEPDAYRPERGSVGFTVRSPPGHPDPG